MGGWLKVREKFLDRIKRKITPFPPPPPPPPKKKKKLVVKPSEEKNTTISPPFSIIEMWRGGGAGAEGGRYFYHLNIANPDVREYLVSPAVKPTKHEETTGPGQKYSIPFDSRPTELRSSLECPFLIGVTYNHESNH